jgi:hypothetical protein
MGRAGFFWIPPSPIHHKMGLWIAYGMTGGRDILLWKKKECL